jgi:hypothetical protein
MKTGRITRTLFLAMLLASCIPAPVKPEVEPSATPTASASPQPTSTIVWFPPTPTATPIPTLGLQPTPDLRPGIGDILLEDDFSSRTGWNTSKNDIGSIAFGIKELTIAISQPKGSLLSLYTPSPPENFYLEITVSPSLCRGADTYGMLLRAASTFDYYQFAISCEGQLRLDQYKNGKLNAPIQAWTPSGQVAPGSPQVLRLGVWALKDEIRFFINDTYQFTARGLPARGGQIGIFAHSGGTTALTVNYSNLVLRSLAATVPTAPAAPQPPAGRKITSTPYQSATPIPSFTPKPPATLSPVKTVRPAWTHTPSSTQPSAATPTAKAGG